MHLANHMKLLISSGGFLILGILITSVLISYYIYDVSNIYQFNWVDKNFNDNCIVNINAGFDETSGILKKKFPKSTLISLDFYNPKKHTEVSIKRARKAYPPSFNTQKTETNSLNLKNNSIDKIFVTFSAHEIRNSTERILFFKELHRIIKPDGEIYISEHLRDTANFIAFTIGFLHFYSKNTWFKTFSTAKLFLKKEIKTTLFTSTFILHKNGNTP